MDKYVVDLHGNYAPSQGNRTIATSYLAQSIQATAAACQVLAGTPGREPYHQVIRMAETLGPEGAKLTALEDHWIDTYLAPCLVRVHKQAEAGCSMFQLCDCIIQGLHGAAPQLPAGPAMVAGEAGLWLSPAGGEGGAAHQGARALARIPRADAMGLQSAGGGP
jgi:hypothetical protein